MSYMFNPTAPKHYLECSKCSFLVTCICNNLIMVMALLEGQRMIQYKKKQFCMGCMH